MTETFGPARGALDDLRVLDPVDNVPIRNVPFFTTLVGMPGNEIALVFDRSADLVPEPAHAS